MSRILDVLNVMIDGKQNMEEVTHDPETRGRYYFRYLGPRLWSVEEDANGGITARYYPNSDTLETMSISNILEIRSNWMKPEGEGIREVLKVSIEYSDGEWTSREAKETFKDLYKTVRERCYNVDNDFDKIIASGRLSQGAGS